ncbi:unnamed protein product [Durusdinium trenchii]|uniref:Small ribosomal subunit biogenesis GTPase RsgA n=1 Tax=Durusdinium trenchii TaxID=1381693 RepID=A0ABP0R3W4_9DINO
MTEPMHVTECFSRLRLRQTERDVAIGLTSLVKMCWTGSGRRLASSRKAKSRTTLAQIQARLRARKEARDRRQSLKRDEEIPETEEEVSDEDDEDWEDFGYASGYVVGGAERHGQVLVKVNQQTLVCRIPKGRRAPNMEPIVGDEVKIRTSDAEAVVEEVLPRRSTLIRRQTMKPQVLCANLDLAVLVLSTEPNFSEGMVDRVLVSAHAQSLDVVLVLNKADLVPRGSEARHRVERRLFVYEKIGYKVLFVSALEGEGLEDLRSLLGGRTSILVGNSGVGKSCLLNKLGQGQIEVTVGDISEKLKLGRHITTTTTMHRLPGEGPPAFLIDSPGARRFSIWDVKPEELKEHFIEFIPFARHCKFSDCRHLQEPGCMVKQAVEEGDVPPERYMSYQRIYQVLLEGTEGSFRSALWTESEHAEKRKRASVREADIGAPLSAIEIAVLRSSLHHLHHAFKGFCCKDSLRSMELIMTDENKDTDGMGYAAAAGKPKSDGG